MSNLDAVQTLVPSTLNSGVGGAEQIRPGTPIISVQNVGKRFGTLTVLSGISLEIARGKVVALIGPSGSGKTTLLRCINFLEDYQEGQIHFNGQPVGYRVLRDGQRKRETEANISRVRAQMGMVFQHFNLWPHKTILANVIEGPLVVKRWPKKEATELALGILERVGLRSKADTYPSRLSGGQKQRVAIARALAMQPKAMLFDEPTSALDPELVGEVLVVMRDLATGKLWQRESMTMVVVTHEMAFARSVANRIIMIDHGQIVEQGSPEQVLRFPVHERTRAFISSLRRDL